MVDDIAPSAKSQREERDRRRRNLRLTVLASFVLLVVLLGVDNGHDVPVEYLVGESQVALVWVILVSLIAGAVLERGYSFVRGRKRDD